MNNRRRGIENLSDADHENFLNNDAANLQSRIATYHEYVEIGFEREKALENVGLTKEDLE